jgi:2-polyprenyl-6-methoxyphenol hydroxylase-like FAD-dependent oxidoreductase
MGAYVAYFTIPRGAKDSSEYARGYNATRSRSLFLRPSPAGTGVYLNNAARNPAIAAAVGKDVDTQKKLMEPDFAGFPDAARVVAGMYAADDFYFDKVVQVRAPRWAAGRVALVGDAAFCPSPFTGMGTSLAIHGAYVMAGELIPALRDGGDDVPAALENYERNLRPYVQEVQKVPFFVPRVFHPHTSLGIWLLDLIVWLVSVSGVTKLLRASTGEEYPLLQKYDWTEEA